MCAHEPFLFNCWKHHLNHIRRRLEELPEKGISGEAELRYSLLTIGENVLDLYLGSLSPLQIMNELTNILKSNEVYQTEKYIGWLKLQGNYRQVSLSDGSVWTLRRGETMTRYVHLHPSRYAPHTTRLKAASLKTAIAAGYEVRISNKKIDLPVINRARRRLTGLPPIKSVPDEKSGFAKMLNLLGLKDTE